MDHHQPEIEFQNLPAVLSRQLLIVLLNKLLADQGMRLGKLSYAFVPREKIIDINKRYLNHHYSTDIITFDYVEDNIVAGEVFICDQEVIENAGRFSVDLENEFVRVCVHGLLHLVGFADASDEEKATMRGMEERYLKKWNELRHGEV